MQFHFFQVNRLVSIILKEDRAGNRKYKYFKDKDELSWKTPLHLVAELNYTTVAQTILCHYPGQLYITTNPHTGNKNRRYIPLELALIKYNDEVSALLIEHMKPERYVAHVAGVNKSGLGDAKDTRKRGKVLSLSQFLLLLPPPPRHLHPRWHSVPPVYACCTVA